jgi:hypothetical protein
MTVRMDHDVDEVRIVERRCRAVIGRVIELTIRLLPLRLVLLRMISACLVCTF